MFKKFANWLYRKYGDRDVVSMTRIQLLGTTHKFDIEELPPPDRKRIATEAKMLLESPAYLMAINNVKRRVMTHIQDTAENADVIFYDRMIINGVKLLEEEIQDFASIDEQPTEMFDPLEAI